MTTNPEVCHPQDFPRLFGLKKVPSTTLLMQWKSKYSFPASLVVPQGHYRVADVLAWLRAQQTRTEAGQKKRGPKQWSDEQRAKHAATVAARKGGDSE
jgi:hypothetical protein